MKTIPYWVSNSRVPGFPKLDKNLKVDVAVIGGGITGVTTAYLLKKAGYKVALLERDRCGTGDTGNTTAHLTFVTDTRLHELVNQFGRHHAQAVWDAGTAAINLIHETMHTEEVDCDFTWVPGYLHHPQSGKAGGDDIAALKKDAQLATDLGFAASYLEQVPYMKKPGIRFPDQAKFHPLKYLAGLLKQIPGRGSHVFEQTDVTEFVDKPLKVKANGHAVSCKHVVIATHVPLQGMKGTASAALFQTKLASYTSYVVGARIPANLIPEASFWDTGDPYYYLRIERRKGHDYAIFGGEDRKTGQEEDAEMNFARLGKKLLKVAPGAVIDHRWLGQVVETVDGIPLIGETAPQQFAATGFSGNGMTFGTVGAMMACDWVAGKSNPWKELFSPDRKKLSGVWDYLKENKDYPYYMLKDRLSRTEAKSPKAVKRGEGKLVQLDGEKVAAYRDEKGKLTVKSAVCPHMGCLVRWNDAGKTWDCPCHGSRFKATGEVIAGPAETGLGEAKEK